MKKVLLVLLVIGVLGAGGFVLFRSSDNGTSTRSTSQTLASESTKMSMTNSESTTSSAYTAANVAEHDTTSDCWTIINGSVYNITTYVPQHPGGVSEIARACGVDATNLFNSNPEHNGDAVAQLARLKIGTLN